MATTCLSCSFFPSIAEKANAAMLTVFTKLVGNKEKEKAPVG